MPQSSCNTLSMTVNRTSDFVLNGTTFFTVKGVTMRDGQDRFFTLCIPASSVSSRQVLSELSLVSHGNLMELDFKGTITNDGFVAVDTVYSLQVRR